MGENKLPSLQIVFEQTEKALDRQFEQVSSLDTKLSILLGAAGIIFAALLSIASTLANVCVSQKVLFGSGTLLILLSLISAALGYRVYRFHRPPNPRVLRTDYIVKEDEETKLSIIDESLSGLDRNQRVIAEKISYIRSAFFFLGSGIMLLAVAFVLLVVI